MMHARDSCVHESGQGPALVWICAHVQTWWVVQPVCPSHPSHHAGEDTALAPLTTEVNQVLSKPGVGIRAELGRLGQRYVSAMREMAPADRAPPLRIIDKMLRNLWLVGYIDLLVPKAKIIHVMRHPMDAGVEMCGHVWRGLLLPHP